MEVVAKVISGEHGDIVLRQKSGERIEIGDLLVIDGDPKYILQVFNLQYGSQHDPKWIQYISGKDLERRVNLNVRDRELRYYILAEVKAILEVSSSGETRIPKSLPEFFSEVRPISESDLEFLTKPQWPLYLGKIRSGSKVLDFDVYINGRDALTHHILIPATTGRGKSNLMKVILWDMLSPGRDYAGMLVLDPHNEYYGALKDHPLAGENLVYYTPPGLQRSIRGARTLELSIDVIRPWHFNGIVSFTEAQTQAMYHFYQRYGEEWLRQLLLYSLAGEMDEGGVHISTLMALQRKLRVSLGLDTSGGDITSTTGVFRPGAAKHTVRDIVNELEMGRKVIIDTSRLSDQAELLIASIIANEILRRYKDYMSRGVLKDKPVISIVLEEAPRVLSTPTGEPSIFGTIAREGRKFRVGLVAITQLVSLIPHEVLANMNTKIILGNEMASERKAIISSASQDLSRDDKMIASLDKGEAIVSSVFTRFAIPIKAPLFDDYRKEYLEKNPEIVEMARGKNDLRGLFIE